MLGIATGLAIDGKIPFVYSITPFLLYRPFEFIRNYLDHEKHNVKLVGGGRGKDYGYLGFSHWADEDYEVMNCLRNIKQFRPDSLTEMIENFNTLVNVKNPCYINLCR